MKRNDLIMIIAILFIAIAMLGVYYLNSNTPAGTASIILGGKLYGKYDLGTNQTIKITTENIHNELIIENNSIHMSQANCPDKYCIRQGKMTHNNQLIVCLPNKLVVELSAAPEGDVDVIVN